MSIHNPDSPRTKYQLESYVKLRKEGIKYLKELRENIKSPEWPLAVEFGEDVRDKHLMRNYEKVTHLQNQIVQALILGYSDLQ